MASKKARANFISAFIITLAVLFSPITSYAAVNPVLRQTVIDQALLELEVSDALYAQAPPSVTKPPPESRELFNQELPKENFTAEEKNTLPEGKSQKRKFIRSPLENQDEGGSVSTFDKPRLSRRLIFSDDLWLTLGMELGYIRGNTAYDFDHHTSELEFPFNNPMIGGDIVFGYKDFSFISQFWGTLSSSCASDMKDKDWNGAGQLTSHTESSADLDAIIYDGGLRYDFFRTAIPLKVEGLLIERPDFTIGLLGGYRYEKFDYNCYGVKYTNLGGYETHAGEKSITYKVAYQLPYIGMALDLAQESYGLGVSFKWGLSPSGRDVDNHLLRGLTFPAKYNQHGQAYIGGVTGFYKFRPYSKFNFGLDATFIHIDGRTWEDNSMAPEWDKDQSTDVKQWLMWAGLDYRF